MKKLVGIVLGLGMIGLATGCATSSSGHHVINGVVADVDRNILNKNSQLLYSIGPGLRYSIETHLTAYFDYGFQLKKVEDRVKLIVKNGLETYAEFVRQLIENININEDDFEEYINLIKKVLKEFDERSYVSYKKSTFLVGDEIAAIGKSGT